SAQARPDGLGFEVALEPFAPGLTPDAGCLVAAERGAGVTDTPAVDVYGARFEERRELVGAANVPGPHAGGQPVFGVVGSGRSLLERLVWERHQHRAEDLLADDSQIVACGREQRRLHEVPVGVLGCRAPGHELCALRAAG